MATSSYLVGRKKWSRPQGVLWSDNSGTLSNGIYVPYGYEVGADVPENTDPNLIDQFLILSDHNRRDLNFKTERIEQRKRTINGRMRSYHIADKMTIDWSWDNLPSRSFSQNASFDPDTGQPPYGSDEYTADGGAGGVQIIDWYENHKGPFWMYLAYDKYSNFGSNNSAYTHLGQYNQIIQVYFADFNYSVVKRGGSNFDLWNISVSLEEV